MKNIVKHLSLLIFITGITYASCQQRNPNTQKGNLPKRDTLYVTINDSSGKPPIQLPLTPTDYVNDYLHLFTQPQIATLDSMIFDYEKKTTNQVAIVTLDHRWFKIDSFDSFVTKLHNTWGVGQKDKNNGIVIAICTGYRKMRISNGYGIEKVFTNEQANQIIEQIMKPAFKQGDYFTGTKNALFEITKRVPAVE